MRLRTVRVSGKFERQYKKLPKGVKDAAKKKEPIFRENPFAAQLRTHKLSGKDKDTWAFWINYSYRIKFIFLTDEEVLFLEVGTHDIYEK